ncbi:MAG: hypothetical protein FWD48_04210 [Oscillospiraceae bacterium]|nr:hypothetical protein [Oscillospiraceae bacterium]
MQGRYENLSAQELREMFLNSALDADLMSIKEYEMLFGHELTLDEPSADVLMFCTAGMSRNEKYSRDIQKPPFEAIIKKREQKKRRSKSIKTMRRIAAVLIITIVTALFAQGISLALGFNLVDFFRNALNAPDKTTTDFSGTEMFIKDEIRFYNSMNELLETEGLNILFPVGYNFTSFTVMDIGDYIDVWASSLEPNITFSINIGAEIHSIDYTYEENGIWYNISDMGDGTYQAFWVSDTDYYTIIVSDKAVISEIIRNLKEN